MSEIEELEIEWREFLISFIEAWDQAFKDSVLKEFLWWPVHIWFIRNHPEIEYYRQIRKK